MKHILTISLPFLILLFSFVQSPIGDGYKPINIPQGYNHTKYTTEPSDIIFKFAAYTTSFDSQDDNNGDGSGDIWGIPEWVSYEVKKTSKETEKYKRPKWMTDEKLNKERIAPNDASYAVSGTGQLKEVKTAYRYVRGHMCPKNAADRISMEAGYNTHTVLNCVPQLQWQNNGVWKNLEQDITSWADKYGSVWVICGPVFFNKTPSVWLGQNDEVRVAVPDALYKIIIREKDSDIETLCFIIPNIIPTTEDDYSEFLTSIGRVEEFTGLSFLTNLNQDKQSEIKVEHLELSDAEKSSIVASW